MQRLLPTWRPRTCALLAFSCVSVSRSAAFGLLTSSSSLPSQTTCSSSSTRRFSSSANHKSAATTMTSTKEHVHHNDFVVAMFPCLNDNYGFLLHCKGTGLTAAIDTPDAKAYQQALDKYGWSLTHIYNTHHHHDHTGGNLELKMSYPNLEIFGPVDEADKIPGIDISLKGGDEVIFGSAMGKVMDVGGHTKGHIAYYFPNQKFAFVGDSLFSMGCGRMFEGKPDQFWASLQRLRDLPDDTSIYCAHEYTESNAKFAMSVEPGNSDLQARANEVKELRAKGEPTVPTMLGDEKKTNPFLRVDISEEIRSKCGVEQGDSDAEAFAKVRRAKDRF